jgi:HK97 family phage major capsid protein
MQSVFPQFDESSRANGSRLGGVQVYFENEADSIVAPSKPKLALTEVKAGKVLGIMYLSSELMDDSNADGLDGFCKYSFSQELTFRLENAIVSGSGDGQPWVC